MEEAARWKHFLLILNEKDLDHDAHGELKKLRNEFADPTFFLGEFVVFIHPEGAA